MANVVANLTEEDIVSVVAYLTSLPWRRSDAFRQGRSTRQAHAARYKRKVEAVLTAAAIAAIIIQASRDRYHAGKDPARVPMMLCEMEERAAGAATPDRAVLHHQAGASDRSSAGTACHRAYSFTARSSWNVRAGCIFRTQGSQG